MSNLRMFLDLALLAAGLAGLWWLAGKVRLPRPKDSEPAIPDVAGEDLAKSQERRPMAPAGPFGGVILGYQAPDMEPDNLGEPLDNPPDDDESAP